MKYSDILGANLKSDFLNDLFATYDVTVAYEYDRSNENMEDSYNASIPEMGLEFLFDASQQLVSLFMSSTKHTGYNPFEGNDPRSVPFNTGEQAVSYAEGRNIEVEHHAATEDEIFGPIPEWAKLQFENHSVHYQFNANGIELVTLQAKYA